MDIKHVRIITGSDYTKSALYINNVFQCFLLEDGYNVIKKYGETRIPPGTRKITLRTEGGMHQKYLNKYGSEFHKGMLWIRDVDNFEYIYIHVGNSPKDTLGCLLTGSVIDMEDAWLEQSRRAYKKIYPLISNAILNGEEVNITTVNLEQLL